MISPEEDQKTLKVEEIVVKDNDISPFDENSDNSQGKVSIKVQGTPVEEQNGITICQFSINIMKMTTGSGALAVPLAMKKLGLIPCILLYAFFAYSYYYGSKLLLKLKKHYDESKDHSYGHLRSKSEYIKITYNLLGLPGYYVMLFCILVTLWGINIGTMIVMIDLLESIDWSFIGITLQGRGLRLLLCVILTVVMIFFVCLNNTQQLSVISSFGLLTLAISFVILLIYGGINFGINSEIPWVFESFQDVITNMGILLYTLCFSFLLFPLYNDLITRDKPKANASIAFSLGLVTTFYLVMSFFLLLMFQQDENGLQSNVLSNLPKHSVYSTVVAIMMVITLAGNYPLLLLGIYEITEATMPPSPPNRFFISGKKRILSRLCQVLLISILSILIPKFGTILNFIGSFTSTISGQIVPAILYLVFVKRNKIHISTCSRLWTIFYIVIFTIIMIVCTILSAIDLINSISESFN